MKLIKNKINKGNFHCFLMFSQNQQLFDGDCYTKTTTNKSVEKVKKERQQQTKVDYFGGCTNDASYVR